MSGGKVKTPGLDMLVTQVVIRLPDPSSTVSLLRPAMKAITFVREHEVFTLCMWGMRFRLLQPEATHGALQPRAAQGKRYGWFAW